MRRAVAFFAVPVLVSMLITGCSGPEDAVAPPTPPDDDSSTMTIGPMLVRPASAAGFTARAIPTSGPIFLVALYGSQINYLASQAMLDRIVYASGNIGTSENLYICNLDGSNRVRLTNVAGDETSPAWSPDGQTIAFDRQRTGQDREVCLINADGSGAVALTDNSVTDGHPTWAPEGRRIAFHTNRDGNYEIYVMYADGTGATNLTNNGAYDQEPDWSPDLSNPLIVFCSDRDGNIEVYKMGGDGGSPTRLTNSALAEEWPAFHPRGYEIAYELVRQYTWEILVTNTGGSAPRTLVAGPGNQQTVAYSSDGRFVCYTSNADGDYELMLQQTEPPYDRWQLTHNSSPIADAYPDLGSPTLQTDRVVIGPASSDWGGANPIWSNAYGVVAAYAEDGYRNLARIGVSAANAHTIEMTPMTSSAQGGYTTGVIVEAADIVNVREDGGRGQPPILWQLDPLDATAVALYFDPWTGKLLAVMVIADQNYPAGADAPAAVTQRTEGDAVVVEGTFRAVFDGTGKCIADAASAVRITEAAVDVLR